MIPNITQFTGDFPDINDPVTFDARMTIWQGWFDGFDAELFNTVAGMNTALNDNGTVLDTAGEAIQLARNAVVPTDTTGTAASYQITPAQAITAYADGQTFLVRTHLANAVGATFQVAALGALPIQKRNSSGNLIALEASDLQPAELHMLTVAETQSAFELTSVPVNDIITGPGLLPSVSDFDTLIKGGTYDITGNWSNGLLGAGSTAYDASAMVIERGDDAGAYVTQKVFIEVGGSLQEWSRVGTGAGPTWSAWRRAGGKAVLAAEYPSGTSAPNVSNGSWAALDLNTERYDDIDVSLSSNQIVFANAGTYRIVAHLGIHNGSGGGRSAQLRLKNATTAAIGDYGQTMNTQNSAMGSLMIDGVISVAAGDAVEIEGRASGGAVSTFYSFNQGGEVGLQATVEAL